MLLKSIKLAGFKSFADPITIPIRSKLCGIIGPNGCGKSNIIDAVRWVIGESSAKQLRGKSMADVIFNGSHRRKPMARALVELQFENQTGRFGGQFAKYSELSIRREVQRDGQSSYFINNTLCRRRDVLDIFLGTGLGPRSYAIIEQGMVSRLIEAKPDELRVFIEEAAGVSKYKERRRETENRMKHTRENLDRVDDLLQELQRQMDHLKRQASAAERYGDLTSEWTLKQAQLKAMQWQSFVDKTNDFKTKNEVLLTECEAMKAKMSHCDTALERLQESYQELQQQHNQAQEDYYATGSEVARVEQRLQHQREQISQWQQDLDRNIERIDNAKGQVEQYQDQMIDLQNEVDELSPQKPMLEAKAEEAAAASEQADEAWQSWLQSWENNQKRVADHQQRQTVSQTKIDHSQLQIERLHEQIEQWQRELVAADCQSELADELILQQEKSDLYRNKCEEAKQEVESVQLQIQSCRINNDEWHTAQQALHLKLQSAQGRYTSLNALQEASLGRDQSDLQTWLEQNQLAQLPRLAEQMTVEAQWEHAVESVLGHYLKAVCCEGPVDYAQVLMAAQLPDQSEIIFLKPAQHHAIDQGSIPLPRLADKVDSSWPVAHLLSHIYTAETKAQALEFSSQLESYESIVTLQGEWFGSAWGKLGRQSDPKQGSIRRQQSLIDLKNKMANYEDELVQLQQSIDEGRETLQSYEERRDFLQTQLSQERDLLQKAQGQVVVLQARQDEMTRNIERAQLQLSECQAQLATLRASLSTAQEAASESGLQAVEAEQERERLSAERDGQREAMRQAQAQAQLAKQQVDEFDIRLAASQDQLHILTESQNRDQTRLAELQQTHTQLVSQLENTDDTEESLSATLEDLLQQRLQKDGVLQEAAARLSQIEEERNTLLDSRKEAAGLAEGLQFQAVENQLEHKEIVIRQRTLMEQLEADGYKDVMQLLNDLPEQASESQWKQNVITLKQKIDRLGPINLAAIDELAQLHERHQHLNNQHLDLIEALEILETAMAKIDQETKQKFISTFDAVNVQLSELFPTVFNGGQAYLELVDKQDLSSGVIIRAQPPGKRNSTIQMLSGGEKALVAISLVFAMFQLNPAPFCILDEVDAPLDDVNVGRYCELIKKMSKNTQYLVISHSKITMSTAHQLMGVTMQEPGVSRMVAVDVDEAMLLAEA